MLLNDYIIKNNADVTILITWLMLKFLLKSKDVLYQVSSVLGEVNSFCSSFSNVGQTASLPFKSLKNIGLIRYRVNRFSKTDTDTQKIYIYGYVKKNHWVAFDINKKVMFCVERWWLILSWRRFLSYRNQIIESSPLKAVHWTSVMKELS